MSENKKRSWSISTWCVDHPVATIIIGIIIIIAGATIGVVAEIHHELIKKGWETIIHLTSHGLIIFGEAITALFLLHYVIESKNLKNNEILLQEGADKIQERLNSLMDGFEEKAVKKVNEIQENLFKALLQGMDIMPFHMIEHIRNAQYPTKIIRKNLQVEIRFLREEGNNLIIRQSFHFDIENVGDPDTEEFYAMPLLLRGTSFVEYCLTEASIVLHKPIRSKQNKKLKFKDGDFVGTEHDSKNIGLTNKIGFSGGEVLNCNQYIETTFKFGSNQTVSDHYHSKYYTIGTRIRVLDFPEHYCFNLIPTSPDKRIEQDIEAGVAEYILPFFLPGQGYYFTIEKTIINDPQTLST